MIFLYIFLFLASSLLLAFSGKWLIAALIRVAKFLSWKEFVVAFFIMAFAGSLPNFFVGISAALRKIPELSFGDVVGGNLADLTIVLALATLFARGIPTASKTIQTSSIFTLIIAILPLLLVLDGTLGRGDGIILILFFVLYIAWLFSKDERFRKIYNDTPPRPILKEFKNFLKDLGIVLAGITLILLAAQGIVIAASFFAKTFNVPLALIGILIVGLGNCIPETYFSIISARKGEDWLILGDLMGSVIVCASFVLGIVALICPIKIADFSPFAIARFFLIISAIFFLFFLRTDRKITKKEALFLLGLYLLFVISEITLH
jgi:cation:H+ antiporter